MYFTQPLGTIINGSGVVAMRVTDNIIHNPNGGSLVALNACFGVTVTENTVNKDPTFGGSNLANFVDIPGSGSNRYIVAHNNGGGFVTAAINSPSPGAQIFVGNNVL
jgi:hypothetical protein